LLHEIALEFSLSFGYNECMDTMSKEASLPEIIERARQGDKEAFTALYRLYYTPLFRYVFMRVRDMQETEDIVADTFLKSYQAFERYQHERETMLPYLFTIARNLLINQGKKKRPDLFFPEEIDRYSGGDGTDKQALDRERHDELRGAMNELTKTEREVIELRFFGERTYEEIADAMEKNEDAIRQHVARAMKKMRRVLEKPTI
jgi:RNA polymerase sigma-70 factor, ECF subfamily